jgi:hypothetical protein
VNKFGCELPTTLELTTLALLTYITSSELPPTRLFPDKPLTFSRTSEQIKAYPMIAGRYEERGFTIFDDPSVNFKDPSRGAAARRVIA